MYQFLFANDNNNMQLILFIAIEKNYASLTPVITFIILTLQIFRLYIIH